MDTTITPCNTPGDHKVGTLYASPERIEQVVGFPANCRDDESKVKYSWGFMYKGERLGIWDYYGSYRANMFSFFGPPSLIAELFGETNVGS